MGGLGAYVKIKKGGWERLVCYEPVALVGIPIGNFYFASWFHCDLMNCISVRVLTCFGDFHKPWVALSE